MSDFDLSIARLVFGLIVVVFLALRVAVWLEKRRAIRALRENTSGGTPVVHSLRERILFALFCCFFVGVVVWLW
jgi:type II secretory pathway component PulF